MVYVLGAYGLIGSACVKALINARFDVVGVGRSKTKGYQSNQAIDWCEIDIATATVDDWQALLSDADIIVNAAGALQNGTRDNLNAIHEIAIARIFDAIGTSGKTFIQISAAGADANASTDFMRSKARGDQIVMESELNWYVFRPTLVISRDAYGGTALLRAAAAFPWVNLRILPKSKVQIVAIEDVARAVTRASMGLIKSNFVADITADEKYDFDTLKTEIRKWLGLPKWKYSIEIPGFLLKTIGMFADILGWLGWRSPFRSNALTALHDGIAGNSTNWISHGGTPCRSLEQTLSAMPATIQERWFARLYLLRPLGIATLALFWIASGAIGLYSHHDAENILVSRGLNLMISQIFVIGGAIADIALGVLALVRKTCKNACLGMIGLSLVYLIGSLITAPDLWLDPMGPMIKVFPGIALSMLTIATLSDR
ncbi:SDR family oxidoreductase [Thalassospira alkalitolerans]|uniref:SDR family oxidoreductase n=1 Tax=Thalassospira alkalitolerans TaxID=1293890 RepID=UPI003AA8E4B9